MTKYFIGLSDYLPFDYYQKPINKYIQIWLKDFIGLSDIYHLTIAKNQISRCVLQWFAYIELTLFESYCSISIHLYGSVVLPWF